MDAMSSELWMPPCGWKRKKKKNSVHDTFKFDILGPRERWRARGRWLARGPKWKADVDARHQLWPGWSFETATVWTSGYTEVEEQITLMYYYICCTDQGSWLCRITQRTTITALCICIYLQCWSTHNTDNRHRFTSSTLSINMCFIQEITH